MLERGRERDREGDRRTGRRGKEEGGRRDTIGEGLEQTEEKKYIKKERNFGWKFR